MKHIRRPSPDAESEIKNNTIRKQLLFILLIVIALGGVIFGLTAIRQVSARLEESTSKTSNAPISKTIGSKAFVESGEHKTPMRHFQNGTDVRQLPINFRGNRDVTEALRSKLAQPRTLASADLNGDAAPDLVAGYAYNAMGIITIQFGNTDAFAPKDDSVFERMQNGYNPDSLLPEAETVQVPEPVDFLQVGDFNQDNLHDVLFASRGGSLYLLAGDEQGRFGEAEKIALPGTVTALTSGEFRAADGRKDVAVGITGETGWQVLIFDGAENLFNSQPVTYALPTEVLAVEFGELDSDPFMDLAVLLNGELALIHGWGRKTSREIQSRMERVNVSSNVRRIALGHFIWDREGRKEIATLATDGTVSILQPDGLDTKPFTENELLERNRGRFRPKGSRNVDVEAVQGWKAGESVGWKTARTVITNAVVSDPYRQALLMKTNMTSRENDDILVAGSNRLSIVKQMDPLAISEKMAQGEMIASSGDMAELSLAPSDAPTAVLELPRKLNGERNLVVLDGQKSPHIVAEAATSVTVDRFDDPSGAALTAASACTAAPNDCSLRGAVQFANTPANSPTTINLPAGTYTLSTNGSGGCVIEPQATGNTIGDLEINQSTNIMGVGSGSTIVRQTGNGNATYPGDRVFCLNVPLAANKEYTFAGFTITGGRDASGIGGGGIIGGDLDNKLTLTDMRISNNQMTGNSIPGGGGGVVITGGDLTITNSTIGGSNAPCTPFPCTAAQRNDVTLANSSVTNSGAGIGYTPSSPGHTGGTGILTVTGTTFSRNTSFGASGGGAADVYTFAFGFPGGIGSGSASFATSTFSNNSSASVAGGIAVESLATTVATSSFTNNSASNRGGAIYVGGGSLLLDGSGAGVSMSGNTAANGGTSISTAAPVNVSGTGVTLGGSIEISTGGIWTNNAGSTLAPTDVVITGGTLNMNNSTMNVGGNLTIGPAPVVGGTFNGNTGTVNIQGNFVLNAGGTPATTLNAGTGTFNFNGTGAQSITNGTSITFFNLTDSNITQPLTLNNSLAVNGSLNVNGANAILSPVAAAVISGTGTLTGTGTARVTRATGTNDFLTQYTIANKTLTNLTIEYAGAAAQGVSATTYGNLRIKNASGASLSGNVTVGGTLTLQTGNLAVGTNTLTLNGASSLTGGSFSSGATGTVNYNQGSNGQVIMSGNYGNLTFSNFNKDLTNANINVAGVFTPGTATGHTITGSTFNFNGAGAQTIPVFTYNNLNISGNRGGANVTLASGTINVVGNFNQTATNLGYINTGNTFDFSGTGAQTIGGSGGINFNNLTVSNNHGGSTVAFTGNIGVAGAFNLPATNVVYSTTGSTFIFNGSAAQNVPAIPGSGYTGLTINNAAGVNLTGSTTVGGVLNLMNGNVNTGVNVLTIGGTGSITRTSGHVIGDLEKIFTATGSFTYHTGTSTAYSPVTVNVTNLATNPSRLKVKTNDGTAPATPALDDTMVLDRYWSLTETGDLTADVTFNYLQADVDGNENIYRTIRVNAMAAVPMPNGTPCPGAGSPCINTTANTIFVGGLSSFSDWTAGIIPTTVSSINRNGSNPSNASSVSWTITFADAVTNLTSGNFALANSGLGGSPAITGVAPVGAAPATQWTVTASTGTGTGTLGLNMTNSTGLSHEATNLTFTGEVYTIDLAPPETTINTNPTNPSNSNSAAFTFSGTDIGTGVASFECKLDGGSFAACTSPQNYSSLADGSHTFQVRAIDGASNVDASAASFTWTIDTTPPDTSITANPPAQSGVNVSFSFTGSDPGGSGVASFECQLDGGSFTACTSPQAYNSLADGSHTFSVRAIDNTGNVDASPASYTWNVDGTAPDTTINTNPTNPSNSSSASFTFSGTDSGSGVASFECKLDAGSFAACTSPNNLTTLADGSHTFQVRAVDGAGNADASPASYTWTIDTVAPDTSITTNPTNPSGSNVSFTFSGSDPGGTGVASFECKLDAGAFAACTSPQTYNSLADGSHTFTARAIDGAGNVDATPASFTWTVDTAPPDTSITANPSDPSGSNVSFSFTGSDAGSGVASFECKLDAGSFAACTSPKAYTNLAQGSHTFEVRAIDGIGNIDPTPASFTWTVDATAPDTTINSNPTNPSNSSSASFTFSGTDTGGSTVAGFECKLDGGSFAACTSPQTYNSLSDGSHTFQVRAIDGVGNVDQTPASYTWVVDATAPDTSITANPTNPSGSNVSFSFTGTDTGGSGVASFECQLDGGGFAACTSPKAYNGLTDGSHTFQVRAIDASGNPDPSTASFTWVVDTLPPDTTITANPSDPSGASVSFSFTGTDAGSGVASFECQLDGGGFSACTSAKSYTNLAQGSHTFQVRAIDNVNNTDPTPASFTWNVDATAPDTTIDANPPNPSSSGNASFSFSGTDSGGSTVTSFECSLDGGPFAACTSPQTYTGLSDGSHAFQVRAIDGVGNVDATPASYTWTVDATGPDTTITANPTNPSNSSSASFSFTGTDTAGSGVASFECDLDGGGFTACTTGQTYNSLTDGSHTFQVRAIDNAGNQDASPASFTWTVDTAPPDTSITANPPSSSNSANASFSFTGTDSGTGVASFECKLDGGSFAACTSPQTYTGLSDGSHTFQVRAIDGIGNVDPTPASYTWMVDTDPPDVSINQAAGQSDPANGMGIQIHFTAVFNEPVTGFTNGDVTIGGTAGATTVTVTEISPMNGTTFDVAVSGMTTGGTVTASIGSNKATDAAGNGNTASTSTDNTVTYVPNTSPTAVADSYSTTQDTPLTVAAPGVLSNDSDPDAGNTITAVLVAGPTNSASFSLNANGSFNYTPNPGFTGTDSFTYKARDNFNAESNTVTVTLSVKYRFAWVANGMLSGSFNEQGLNQVTAGSNVALRFTLYGYKGDPYSMPPTSEPISCSTFAPTGAATAINRFTPDPFYSSLYDFYQTTWQTQTAWKFTCRRLTLHFNDGTTRSLNFYFK